MLAEVGEAAASLGRQVGDELAQVAHAPGRTDLLASGKGMQQRCTPARRRLQSGGRLRQLPPGVTAEVVLVADGDALSLPVELIRLAGDAIETGPLGLLPNASITRRIAGARLRGPCPRPLWGPLKILAALAAPDETTTPNAPLNVEREMDAVLTAVTGVAGRGGGRGRGRRPGPGHRR